MNAGKVIFEIDAETKGFEKQIASAEAKLEELEFEYEALSKASPYEEQEKDLKDLATQIEVTKNKIISLQAQEKKAKGTTSDISESFSGIGDGLKGVVSKVSKWALALFGIRSIYMGIRSVIGTVSQYNSDIANKIESIKYTLAMAAMPIVEKIINLVYTLLQYVQYIIKAWTGYDIFASASKNLSSANKSAKELKKSMAGFDTANTLSDTSSSSTSGAIAMTGLSQGEVPAWVQWIVDNKEIVVGALLAIAAAIIVLNVAIAPIPVLIALAVALIAYLAYEVVKHWDDIKATLAEVGDWIYQHTIKPIGDFFSNLWTGIVNGFNTAISNIKNIFNAVVSFFKGIIDKIVGLFKTIGTTVGNVISGAFKAVINAILKTIENVLNAPIKAINLLIDTINSIPGINIGRLSTFNLPKLATGGIVSMPGRGVPIGGAIAGEAGREGVLPLTDAQAMAQLGQEIGKNVAITIDLTNKLDSRVLSRSLQKINNSNTFARNGG